MLISMKENILLQSETILGAARGKHFENLLYNLSFSQSLETYWVWNEKAEMVRQVIMSLNVTPLRYSHCEGTDTKIKLNRVNVIELISMSIQCMIVVLPNDGIGGLRKPISY